MFTNRILKVSELGDIAIFPALYMPKFGKMMSQNNNSQQGTYLQIENVSKQSPKPIISVTIQKKLYIDHKCYIQLNTFLLTI